MKNSRTIALWMAMLAVPSMTSAQENIKKAFDKFTNDKAVEVTTQYSMQKDPVTGQKEGQLDIYTYALPKSRRALLDRLEEAFGKDRESAYSFQSGVNGDGKADESLGVSVGDSNTDNIYFGQKRGMHYVNALFMDPESPGGKYRYAYVAEWLEQGDTIRGRLIVTYATTLKYRMQQYRKAAFSPFSGQDGGEESDSGSWLGEFGIYSKKLKDKPDSGGASVYVNQIYNLSKHAGALTDSERNLVITEICDIEKKLTDSFMKSLLNSAIENIK